MGPEGVSMLSIAERYARRKEVRDLALALMAQHGLEGWSFGFNRHKGTLGICRFGVRTIELSVFLVYHNGVDEVRDTILHEIAHALVGPGHGHDAVWKAKALEIGARPRHCGEAEMPPGRWRAHCAGCGQDFSRHRRPRRLKGWFCQACGPQRGRLTWRAGGT
jgi:predicted SprT family Zn-dependent metalloprotease